MLENGTEHSKICTKIEVSVFDMLRKIVKQGNSALTLTLPSDWAKRFKLKAGDELEVLEEKDFLKISTEKFGEKNISIDITQLNAPLIWTYIIASYRKGYDLIKLNFKKEQMKIVQEAVDALLGLAIIEQSSNSCVIKDLSAFPSEKEFQNIQRRIFYLLEEISESSLLALKNKSKEDLKNIELHDYNINKFSNFCIRIINKKNLEPTLEYIIAELENLGDEYAKLSIDLSESKSLKIEKDILSVFEGMNQFFIDFHKLYYSFSNEKVNGLVEEKNKINKKINSISPKTQQETILLFHLSKILHLITNIGERMIMMKLE
jgi:phosphate uptake regulator